MNFLDYFDTVQAYPTRIEPQERKGPEGLRFWGQGSHHFEGGVST